jgi:MFS family permease
MASSFTPYAWAAALLGVGTAMVYPTLLATVGDRAHPMWRASAVGVYRLWRDIGYAAGAIFADKFGVGTAVWATAVPPLVSGFFRSDQTGLRVPSDAMTSIGLALPSERTDESEVHGPHDPGCTGATSK